MYVVADACAVRCRIVRAKDVDRIAASACSIEHERDEMCLRVVPLADLGLRVAACRVEVAQCAVA